MSCSDGSERLLLLAATAAIVVRSKWDEEGSLEPDLSSFSW